MVKFEFLSKELSQKIEYEKQTRTFQDFSFDEKNATYRVVENMPRSVLSDSFGRDIEKIIHCPYFSRYADKTQVY